MQICPGSRAPPPPSYLYKYGLIPACSSRSVTDRHELGDTNTFPARGRQLLQEEEDRDGVCPRECRVCLLGRGGTNRVHGYHQVRVLVLSASNGNVASKSTYCLFVVCVWIIEDMHTYPKLNSVAVLGRTKNAYWQSQFLCSSSSLHNPPGSQQNTEQVDTSKLLCTPKQLEALQLAASCANLLPNSDCQTKPHLNNNKLHC